MTPLTGFTIRRPATTELQSIVEPFGLPPVDAVSLVVFGAFGQPGDEPLGGLTIRPYDQDKSALFQIMVRREYRRKRVGTRLIQHLLNEARANHATYLRMAALVHQDDPFNAFYRKVGLRPERKFATYTISLRHGILPVTERVARRFTRHAGQGAPHIVSMEKVEPEKIARFFSHYYGGAFDHRLEQMNRGIYDTAMSPVVLKNGEVVAAALFQSKPENPALYLDIILVHPDHRNGPLGQVILDTMARWGIARNFTELVFEADAEHDAFAIGFARRAGCQPKWHRYRYAITLESPGEASPNRSA